MYAFRITAIMLNGDKINQIFLRIKLFLLEMNIT